MPGYPNMGDRAAPPLMSPSTSGTQVLDTKRLKNASGQLWLNVASSTCVEPEFVNFDNHVFLTVSKLPAGIGALLPRKYQPFLSSYRDAKRAATLIRHDCRK